MFKRRENDSDLDIEDELLHLEDEGNEQTWLTCIDGKKDVLYDLTDFLDITKPLRSSYPILKSGSPLNADKNRRSEGTRVDKTTRVKKNGPNDKNRFDSKPPSSSNSETNAPTQLKKAGVELNRTFDKSEMLLLSVDLEPPSKSSISITENLSTAETKDGQVEPIVQALVTKIDSRQTLKSKFPSMSNKESISAIREAISKKNFVDLTNMSPLGTSLETSTQSNLPRPETSGIPMSSRRTTQKTNVSPKNHNQTSAMNSIRKVVSEENLVALKKPSYSSIGYLKTTPGLSNLHRPETSGIPMPSRRTTQKSKISQKNHNQTSTMKSMRKVVSEENLGPLKKPLHYSSATNLTLRKPAENQLSSTCRSKTSGIVKLASQSRIPRLERKL